MKKYFAAASVLLFSCSFAFAQPLATPNTFSFSLQQSLDYAMQHQPTVLNAQIDEEITLRQAQEITALSLPQINGSVQFQDMVKLPTQLLPGEFFGAPAGTFIPVQFGTQYNTSAGITANQLIADGQFFVATKANKTLMELSKKNTQRTIIETKVAVTKAYYSVLVNQKRMDLLTANVDRVKKLKDDSKVLLDNGFIEKIDFDRVSVGYNNLLTEQDNVKQLVSLTYSLLKFQMGMDVNATLTLTDSLSEDALKADELINATTAPQNRIEMQMLNSQKTLYQLNIKRYQMQYLPSVYGFASYSLNNMRPKLDFAGQWYPTGIVGLQIAVPIFDGFLKERKIQEGNLNLQKNANDMFALQNAINLEVNSSKINLTNNVKSLASQKENMLLAESVYADAKKKFDVGKESSLEVVNAETDLKTAQTNYLNALYDAWISKVDLMKANGNIK